MSLVEDFVYKDQSSRKRLFALLMNLDYYMEFLSFDIGLFYTLLDPIIEAGRCPFSAFCDQGG